MSAKLKENGMRRQFWVSPDLDSIIEDVRVELGMSKSSFYRYAIIRLLQDMSVLSTKAKQNMNGQPEQDKVTIDKGVIE